MEWFTHPQFTKYEVNYFGVIRNKKTKRALKYHHLKSYYSPRVCVLNMEGKIRNRSCGAFILEAIDKVRNVNDFIYLDGDPNNNCYANLKAVNKRIIQIDLQGSIVKKWDTPTQARNFGAYCDKTISLVCRGMLRTHAGYYWCYEENLPSMKITFLVATNDKEQLYFEDSKDAYIYLKKIGVTKGIFRSFSTNLSNAKKKGALFLGYKWTTIEKNIKSEG